MLMVNLLPEIDNAFESHNYSTTLLIFKVYYELFHAALPYVGGLPMSESSGTAFAKIAALNAKEYAKLQQGYLDLESINQICIQAYSAWKAVSAEMMKNVKP